MFIASAYQSSSIIFKPTNIQLLHPLRTINNYKELSYIDKEITRAIYTWVGRCV